MIKLKLATVPDAKTQTWLELQLKQAELVKVESRKVNPMIRIFGRGPEGAKCKTCALLTANQCSKRYYKCTIRGVTHGKGTDHLVNWQACAKYRRED